MAAWASLATAYRAASGHTAHELGQVLASATISPAEHQDFGAILFAINSSSSSSSFVRLANGMFIDQSFEPRELDSSGTSSSRFAAAVPAAGGGRIAFLDFAEHSEASRQVINEYVADATGNNILTALEPDTSATLSR